MTRDQKTSNQAHVLVLPFPIQGHINPMLQFSKRLVSKGINVTVITSTSMSKLTLNHSSYINTETIFDGFKDGEKPSTIDEYFRRHKENVRHGLDEHFQKYRNLNSGVNCLIYDSTLPWASDIARKYGVRGAPFFTQSCAVGAAYSCGVNEELNEKMGFYCVKTQKKAF